MTFWAWTLTPPLRALNRVGSTQSRISIFLSSFRACSLTPGGFDKCKYAEYHFGDETVLEAVLAVDEERKKLLEEEELLTKQGQSVRPQRVD